MGGALPLGEPKLDLFSGKSIAEPESDELHHLALLPVGEVVTVLFDRLLRVEKLGRHDGDIRSVDLRSTPCRRNVDTP